MGHIAPILLLCRRRQLLIQYAIATYPHTHDWLVVWNMNFMIFHILRAAAPAADPGKRESDTTVCTMRHRTLLLLLLLLLLFLPKLKTHPAGQGNTVALKDGTAPKSIAKTP